MVLSLLSQSARKVDSNHYLFAEQLNCIPCDLYRPLLDAAFALCRPLAIQELVQRWPLRTLSIGRQRSRENWQQFCLCESALLQAVLRGLTDKRCCLRVLDLCGLKCKDIRLEDPKFGWSRTVAVCFVLLQARNITDCLRRCRQDETDKKKRATERDGTGKRDQTGLKVEEVEKMDCSDNVMCEQDNTNGATRKMELQRRTGAEQVSMREGILLDIFANLFVNYETWDLVHRALRLSGPLRLHCRFLHVEGLPVSSIISLLHLIPQEELISLIFCNSSLGVSGLVLLLPQFALFPKLSLLQLCYCNLDRLHSPPGQQETLQDLSRGFGELKSLRRLSLSGQHLPGLLQLVLSSLSEPLEALALPDFRLTSDDMAYLSRTPHTSSLIKLDLSDNRLDESCLHSLQHLLTQAKGSLMHLSLCCCGLLDSSLRVLLPFLQKCHALRSLRLALNPLSMAALVGLVQAVAGIHSLRLLLCPKPLAEYEPGLPPVYSREELMKLYLIKDSEASLTQLDEVLKAKGCSQDLLVTFSLLLYSTDIDIDD